MKNKGISSAVIIVVVIVIAAAVAGGYIVMSGGGSREGGRENLITENVAELGLKEEEINEILENIQNFQNFYIDNLVKWAKMNTGIEGEELREAGFEEYYNISGKYFEVQFSFEWEKELSEGKAPTEMINRFQERGITLSENTIVTKEKGRWYILDKVLQHSFRVRRENNRLEVNPKLAVSVFSTLNRYSDVGGADKTYESNYERLEKNWKNMDYDPEEKAKEMVENEDFELGDKSFMRYYKEMARGNPNFIVTFRERNVIASVSVSGDVPGLTEKTIELVQILENRLEEI